MGRMELRDASGEADSPRARRLLRRVVGSDLPRPVAFPHLRRELGAARQRAHADVFRSLNRSSELCRAREMQLGEGI